MKQKIYKVLHLLLFFLIIASLIKAWYISSTDRINPSQMFLTPVNEWKLEIKDIQGQKYGEYTYNIPDNAGNELVLGVKGYNTYISVFLDNENTYTYQDEYKEKGAGWRWIELPEDSSGKTLTLRITLYDTDYVPILNDNICLGHKDAVFHKILNENLYAVIWGSVLIIIGTLICLSNFVLKLNAVSDVIKEIRYLGIFILLAGIWIITDSSIMQFITGKVALVSLISFISFMLMPYFLLSFIGKMMFYQKKEITILCRLHLSYMAFCLTLYALRISPLYKTLIGVHLLILISLVIVLKNALSEIRRYENNEVKQISIGLIVLVVFTIIALGFFYNSQNYIYSIFYGIGLFIFIACLIGAAAERLHYYIIASANVEEYHTIAHMDIMTKLGNRMAFLKHQENIKPEENIGCVVLDINDLKLINDQYGHAEGDRLIIDAAECIQTAFSDIGNCYRIGGDEFAVILSTDSVTKIQNAIEVMNQCMEQKNLNRILPIKIAYGYSTQHDNATFQNLFNEADANMYAKKKELKDAEKTQ